MKIILCMVLMTLAGCGGMTLEEQVKATTECKTAGGRIVEVQNGWNFKLMRVDCTFEPEKNYGKACTDKGGVPVFSSWDGSLKDCKFK